LERLKRESFANDQCVLAGELLTGDLRMISAWTQENS